MARVSIYARSDKRDAAGTVPLYVRIAHKNSTRYVSLGLRVKEKNWNAAAEEVRKSQPEHAKLNQYLAGVKSEAQAAIADLMASRAPVTLQALKKRLSAYIQETPQEEGAQTFIAYCDELLEGYRSRGQIATWKAYRTAVKKLKAFAGPDLAFDEVTPGLLRRFQSYLAEEKRDKLGRVLRPANKPNTIHKNISSLQTMFEQAQRDGIIPYSLRPFDAITLRKEKAIKEKLLTEEVRRVAALDLQEGSLICLIRDTWMFAFYAGGMRFSDVATAQKQHIKADEDGNLRSHYRMGKTKNVHGVLLVDEPVAILERYGFSKKKPKAFLFPLLDGYDLSTPERRHNAIAARNALANKYLKKIAELAKIDTKLTFHLSRHSIAGYLLEQGYDVYTIKEILGHETVRVTEDYLRGFKGKGSDEAMRSIRL